MLKVPSSVQQYLEQFGERLIDYVVKFLRENASFVEILLEIHDCPARSREAMAIFERGIFMKNEKFTEDLKWRWVIVTSALYIGDDLSVFERHYVSGLRSEFTYSTPLMQNAGRKDLPTMSACYLIAPDSLEGESLVSVMGILTSANVTNASTGINLRRYKRGQLVKFAKTLDNLIDMANMNHSRNGSANIVVEAFHIDTYEVIPMCMEKYSDAFRYTTLTIWLPDIFFKRCDEDSAWTLFDPDNPDVAQMASLFGEAFNIRYEELEKRADIGKTVISARSLLEKVYKSIVEARSPMLMSRDSCNIKCPQRPLLEDMGRTCSVNLCLEVIQAADNAHTPLCNLGSISLKEFVIAPIKMTGCDIFDELRRCFDFARLGSVVRTLVPFLTEVNQMSTFHSQSETTCARDYGAIGIGVSGFANSLYKMNLSFVDSRGVELNPVTKTFNKMLNACIYFNAVAASVMCASRNGKCAISDKTTYGRGLLQFDLWKEEATYRERCGIPFVNDFELIEPSAWGQEAVDFIQPTYESLREALLKYGVANSVMRCNMPTSTSSAVLGNINSVEAPDSHLSLRERFCGSFLSYTEELFEDCAERGIDRKTLEGFLVNNSGRITGISRTLFGEDLDWIEQKYKTADEIPQRVMIELAGDAAPYIDQSQSMNLFWKKTTPERLVSALRYAHKLGLKTLAYYVISRPSYEERNIACTGGSCTA